MNIKKLWENYYNALKKQDWSKALAALSRIKQIRPRDSQVHLKMGDILQRMGDKTGAVEAYHRAAVYLVKEGFMQKAIGIFKIILRIDPFNSEANVKLEKVLETISATKSGLSHPDVSKPPVTSLPEEKKHPEAVPQIPVTESPKPEEIPEPVEHVKPPDYGETPSYGEVAFQNNAPEPEETGVPVSEEVSMPVSEQGSSEDQNGPVEKEEKDFENFDELLAEAAKELPLSEKKPELPDEYPVCFSPLGTEQALRFVDRGSRKTYSSGERIVEEGDAGDSLFFIKKGRAKVVSHILGMEIVLATLGEGDIFGEVTFLTGRPRTASVIAEGDNEVIEFNRLLLEDAISINPEVLASLNDLYLSRVSDTIRKVAGN